MNAFDKKVLDKVYDFIKVENPYFEFCAKTARTLEECGASKEGDCQTCSTYYKKMCNRGELIEEYLSEAERVKYAVALARQEMMEKIKEIEEHKYFKYEGAIQIITEMRFFLQEARFSAHNKIK